MGADVIGWRGCDLQEQLGPEGFLAKLKLRTYKELIEAQVPPDKRAAIKVAIVVNGPDGPTQRDATYAEICEQADQFARGIPECPGCPLSGGAPLGCYHYVVYPVDATFERTVFDFFVSQVAIEDSICNQLYTDIVSKVPAAGTGWHERRGGDARTGGLAELPAPLVHKWGGMFSKKRVDSAQILHSLFMTLTEPALVVGYSRFWSELVAFGRQRGVTGEHSPTMESIERLAPMFLIAAAGSLTDGWAIFADA